MTRYFVEVSNGSEFFNCNGPLFNSMIEALTWAFFTFPDHDFRALPRFIHA
jgi:hypothetical protein